MTLVLFVAWVLLVFVSSDLIGRALLYSPFFASWRKPMATGAGPWSSGADCDIAFAHSTLLGFAIIWVTLSVAYALGIATGGVLAGFIGVSAVTAALTLRSHRFNYTRSQFALWGLLGGAALLASLLTPTVNLDDDPEYFFLINKLLRTGSVIEYFNERRPIALGGWTFIQAIFSAGPAGAAFVSSVDAAFGGIIFLLCAILLGIGAVAGLAAALIAVLAVEPFQVNLGIAIGMAALCSIVVALSLARPVRRHPFPSLAFAVMAMTVRPQLALIATVGIAVVFVHNRPKALHRPAVILAGLIALWVAIFVRDTGLPPISMGPGYNPQVLRQVDNPAFDLSGDLSTLAQVGGAQWVAGALTLIALAICGWGSTTNKVGEKARMEFQVLGAFLVAAVATVVGMVYAEGPTALEHQRYYIPIVEGVLFTFLIYSVVRILPMFPHGSNLLAGRSSIFAFAIAVLSLIAFAMHIEKSPPMFTGSSRRICAPLLLPTEQRMLDPLVSSATGNTLLTIACPVDSFVISPKSMMNDLFWSTRGEYVDVDWPIAKLIGWLQKHEISQVIYLANDSSPSFGLQDAQNVLSDLIHGKLNPLSRALTLQWEREFTYQVKSLEALRSLAQYCASEMIPIHDPQGPLVIIDVSRCEGRARAPLRPSALVTETAERSEPLPDKADLAEPGFSAPHQFRTTP